MRLADPAEATECPHDLVLIREADQRDSRVGIPNEGLSTRWDTDPTDKASEI